jgi:hypothetical protein
MAILVGFVACYVCAATNPPGHYVDMLALLTLIVAIATFLLAVVAGFIAIAAYSLSTLKPDIAVQISLPGAPRLTPGIPCRS